jgi:hypothetical protein
VDIVDIAITDCFEGDVAIAEKVNIFVLAATFRFRWYLSPIVRQSRQIKLFLAFSCL